MHAGSGDTTRPAHDVDGTRYQVAAWRQLAADVEAHPAPSLEDLNGRARRACDLCVCGHVLTMHVSRTDKGYGGECQHRCYCPRFMPHPQPAGMHRTPELRDQERAHAGGGEVDAGNVVVGVDGDQDGARGVGDLRFAGAKLGALGDDLRAIEGGLHGGHALGGSDVSAGHDLGAVDGGGEGSAVAAGPRDLGGRGAGGRAAGVTPTATQDQEQGESMHGASGPASYREIPALWTVNVWSDGNTTGPHGRVWWNVDVYCGAKYRFAIYGSATREQAERDGIAFVRREDDRASITIHRKAPRPSLLDEMADANWEGDPMEALMLMRTLTEDVRDRVLFELKRREETYNALPDTVWVGEAATMKDLEDEFICRVFAALEGGAL